LILHTESEQKHIHNDFAPFHLAPGDSTFKHNVFIDLNYNRSLICDKVFNRIIKGIRRITWNSVVTNEVDKICSMFHGNALGVSVRSWTASHENNIKR